MNPEPLQFFLVWRRSNKLHVKYDDKKALSRITWSFLSCKFKEFNFVTFLSFRKLLWASRKLFPIFQDFQCTYADSNYIHFSTRDGSAKKNLDYEPVSGVLVGVLHFTSNILHFTSNLLHFTSNLLHFISNLLHFTSNLLYFTSNLLHFTSNLLHFTSNLLHFTSDVFHFTSNLLAVMWLKFV